MTFKDLLLDDLKTSFKEKDFKKLNNFSENELSKYFVNNGKFSKFKADFEQCLNIQVCFLIDVTGSMHSKAKFTNKIVGLIIDTLFEFMNESSLKHYAFIGYRERHEENVQHDFTDDLKKIRDLIENVPLEGGEDDSEDVENAFKLFLDNIDFKQGGTRILVHIADAPCHGRDYTDLKDDHPDWSNNIPRYLKKIACSLNCAYWFVKLTDDTDKMIKKFNEILKKEAPESEFNQITVLDLKDLKDDVVRDILNDQIFKTTISSTVIAADK
jgi:hypothetical protein